MKRGVKVVRVRAVPAERTGRIIGATSPSVSLYPEPLEHPVLLPWAGRPSERAIQISWIKGLHAGTGVVEPTGGSHGSHLSTLWRAGRAQGSGGGLRPAGRRPGGEAGDEALRHDHAAVAPAFGLAGEPSGDARGDGVDGRVLEAGLAHPGRGVRAGARQGEGHAQRAGPEKRRERFLLDHRVAGARADSPQLRPSGADPGDARPDPYAQATGAGAGGER